MQPLSLDAYHALLKALGKRKKGGGATTIQVKKKRSLKKKLEAFSEITPGRVSLTLPILTVSEANCFEHWTKRDKRHKAQQKEVHLALIPVKCQIKMPCHIHLIRYAPKSLDRFDNLPVSFKYIVDRICAVILDDFTPGHADNDSGFSFSCDQVISKAYGVKIIITNIQEFCPN